jgi:predicted nucleic acid-binding protein
MILVDTSIWVDHLRRGDPTLAALLQNGQVLGHPAVAGEFGLGMLANRDELLGLLANLPQAVPATHAEAMTFITQHRLFGLGIGYVDVQLLASTALTGEAALWTRDKRLHATADRLGLARSIAAPS